jgi:spore germination cell wall hydrolase CwlJ-like protein
LSIEIPARVNPRALGGAILAGAGMGLVLAVAYLAGGAAKTAAIKAQAGRMAAATAPAAKATPAAFADAADQPILKPVPAALHVPQPALPVAADVARGKGALECLTDAVYYEARGESDQGQAAVAQVVLNRVRRGGFPKSVCGVVFQGVDAHTCQFSFACDGAMGYGLEPAAWRRARVIAQRALDGFVMQEVGDATNFHVARLGQIWGSGLVKVAQVGAHVFYRLTGHGTFTAHPSAGRSDDQPDDVTAIPADGGDEPNLILASAVTVKPMGEGGPIGPVPEPASAPAASTPAPAKLAAPGGKPATEPATQAVSTAAKAEG